MPPVSNPTYAPSKLKDNRFSTSPDSETCHSIAETRPVSSKRKKKNAATKQAPSNGNNDHISSIEVAKEDSLTSTRPQTILNQLHHGFALPIRKDSPLLDVGDEDIATTEKVSDQYTPPNDAWLEEKIYRNNKTVQADQQSRLEHDFAHSAEPGFSRRTGHESKSLPMSPPTRYARPLSYGGIVVPPMPPLQRASPSAYSYTPSTYGSPPAPHLPQPHFYQARDIGSGRNMPGFKEEPSLVRYVRLPSAETDQHSGLILGFEGRVSIMMIESNKVKEVGIIDGLAGTVIDAVLLDWTIRSGSPADAAPLLAVVVHGPKDTQFDPQLNDRRDETRQNARQQMHIADVEYTTRVEVYSIQMKEMLAVLLETPPQFIQSAFRGAPATSPSPDGQFRLEVSGGFLVVSSGASGEVFTFMVTVDSTPKFECISKFWAAVQSQKRRRESSHHQSSDPDLSPADLGRAIRISDRAMISLNGRWLALAPATSPSRPALGAVLGPDVVCGRHAMFESRSAPARPSITCEVESADTDTILGKVARGVAQELVKGAKWLGDQGYQTWQNYWRKDQPPSIANSSPVYSPPMQPAIYPPGVFPPTHAEAQGRGKEPELVSIFDLQAMRDISLRKGGGDIKPLATFQPSGGCSFISFAPHGLLLLTASRKGDVQYIWDLMQIKHCRTHVNPSDGERNRSQPRIRQVAKYERLSGATIVDVAWDTPAGTRFAILTMNKTIHLFDLPLAAFRWPPLRASYRSRQLTSSNEKIQSESPVSNGLVASAMNMANQAQPVIANWRGRAPSMGGGLAGIGQTGIGLASATGARGGKAVAAGLSKSLGAASETVHHLRHAGESRLHLKSSQDLFPDRLFWCSEGRRHFLAIIDSNSIKQYQVGRTKQQERPEREEVTVFAARRAHLIRMPDPSQFGEIDPTASDGVGGAGFVRGIWQSIITPASNVQISTHPLSFAEIEPNAPYQPFHSDRRVTLSIFSHGTQSQDEQLPTVSALLSPRQKARVDQQIKDQAKWVFGAEIPTTIVNASKIRIPGDDEETGSIIYRETIQITSPTADNGEMDHIVSTTRRRKVNRSNNDVNGIDGDVEGDDGFFEDDCDVLDFATDRV